MQKTERNNRRTLRAAATHGPICNLIEYGGNGQWPAPPTGPAPACLPSPVRSADTAGIRTYDTKTPSRDTASAMWKQVIPSSNIIHLSKPWHASLSGLVPPLIPAPFDGSSFRSCSLFRLTGADSAVFAHIPIRPHQRHVVTCYPYGTHPSVPPLILAPFDGSSWLSALRRWPSRSCGRSRCSRRPR